MAKNKKIFARNVVIYISYDYCLHKIIFFLGRLHHYTLNKTLENLSILFFNVLQILFYYLHVIFNDMLIYNDFSTFKTWNQDQLLVIFFPMAWFVHQSQMPKNPLKKFAPMIVCNSIFFSLEVARVFRPSRM